MNTENNNTNEPYEFVLHLSQKLDLRSSNEYVAIQTYLFITRGKIQ